MGESGAKDSLIEMTILEKIWKRSERSPSARRALAQLYNLISDNRKKIRGRGNRILTNGAFLHRCRFDIRGNNNSISIGWATRISNTIFYLRGDNHQLIIGKNCVYEGDSFCLEDKNCRITLGEKTTVLAARLAAAEDNRKIKIGRDCLLAYDIDIRTTDSHLVINRTSGKRLNPAQDVIIADHVWVAAGVKILKGVRIAADSVVAAGAIVTKPFSTKGVIIAGIPAKIIKRNINWTRHRLKKE